MNFFGIYLCYKLSYLNQEVNCTKLSGSVSVHLLNIPNMFTLKNVPCEKYFFLFLFSYRWVIITTVQLLKLGFNVGSINIQLVYDARSSNIPKQPICMPMGCQEFVILNKGNWQGVKREAKVYWKCFDWFQSWKFSWRGRFITRNQVVLNSCFW